MKPTDQSSPQGDSPMGEDLWHRYGAEHGVWTEAMLSTLHHGRVRGNRWFSLIDKVASEKPLGIPTVRDRVVQGAVKLVIEPIFEQSFCANSYGFRPNRGCKDALRKVEEHLSNGYHQVIDLDTRGYFDAIPHERLMSLVKKRISDSKVLGLIEAFLNQGILEDGIETVPGKGSPQGGLISPLLANIYLNPLDWIMQEKGIAYVRYADDIVVLVKSESEAKRTLQEIREWMEEAQLELHPEKTRIVDISEANAYFDFLGYRFKRSKRGRGRGRDHNRWPNRYFETLGLFSLEQAKVKELGLLKRANC